MIYIRHMIRTQVYLPEQLYQEINLVSKKEKKAAAQVVRELLEEGLLIKKKSNNIGKALIALSKVNARGPKDLSNKIDDYLYAE